MSRSAVDLTKCIHFEKYVVPGVVVDTATAELVDCYVCEKMVQLQKQNRSHRSMNHDVDGVVKQPKWGLAKARKRKFKDFFASKN
jgi:hypothetical protein